MANKNKTHIHKLDIMGTQLGLQQVRGEMQSLEQTLGALQMKLAACFGAGLLTGWLWQTVEKSGQLNGVLKELDGAFGRLANAVGNALAPAAKYAVDFLTEAVKEATKLANYFGEILQVLFGTDKTVQKTTASQKKLTAATKVTSKALQRSIMGFDQLNRLQKKASSSGGTKVSTAGTQNTPAEQTLPKLDFSQTVLLEMLKGVAQDLRSIDFGPAIHQLGLLYEAVKLHIPTLYAGLNFFWDEILFPLTRWTIEEAVPKFLKLLTVAVQTLSSVIYVVKPALVWLWEKLLVPMGQWAGQTLLNALDWLTQKIIGIANWAAENREMALLVAAAIALVTMNLLDCNGAFGNFGLFGAKSTSQMNLFGVAMGAVKTVAGSLGTAVAALGPAILLAVSGWNKMTSAAGSAWQGVKNAWQGASAWFRERVLNPLGVGFRNTANSIIGSVNGVLRGICSGINAAIKAVNGLSFTLPRWIPGLGGKTLGFHLKTVTAPQIPYLAQGAVLPANKPFLAMVGDQRHGTNVEAPLATIQEAVAAVMGDFIAGNMAGHEATVAVLREILEAVLGISIGDDVIASAVSRYNTRMAVVKGGQV
ncbi:MAG: hypothetical protein J6A74_01260 [Oscillospiraceae bacterium]|nr:hypothetical protein [Oscillospiraceae bacterium]